MNTKFSLLFLGLSIAAMPVGAKEHLKSLDKGGIDTQTPAKQDFYQHVNKGWMDSHPLSAEYSRYGQFNVLTDSSNNRIKRIVTNLAATNPQKGTNAYKIAALYETGMDSVRRNQLGATPILAHIARIENATPEEMTDLFLWMHKNFSSPFIGVSPMEDLANSSV